MKRKTNTAPSNLAPHLITAGILIILTTPLIKPLYLAIAQSDCPLYGERRLCGFEPGFEIGMNAVVLPLLWLSLGAAILIVGIVRYRNRRKNLK